jgi:hypothetical protein
LDEASRFLVLDHVRVAHGPADALDQLAREVSRLQIGGGDSLSIDHPAGDVRFAVGHYKYLRHENPPSVEVTQGPS